ncbi:hypothetical protein GW17_00059412 [Ensete ventricosum]|nr:hypothetical protein GW17_00059412 [Ensete ventricosum]
MTGAMELQPDDGPSSSLGIGPGSDDVVGPHREFTRRFTEGIRKLTRNMSGDHWKKIGRLTARMSEVAGLARVVGITFLEILAGKPPVSSGWTARTLETERLPVVVSG